MALTNEQAIEHYTELSRRVSVGAYLELQHDGSYPEDDGSPESTTLESLDNLETWARNQGLQFEYNLSSKTYSLVKIAWGPEPGEDYEDDGEEVEGDGSGLHQCPYCYDLVYEEHEEFCSLNPHRNRNIVP